MRPAEIISTLTPRQRRLRVWTLVFLAVVIAMVVVGLAHPFFRRSFPVEVTEPVRRALVVRLVFIAGYWSLCLMFTLGMAFCAWQDLREVRFKLLAARKEMWKELSERTDSQPESRKPL